MQESFFYIREVKYNWNIFAILAENIFGSYSRWWEIESIPEEDINKYRNKIKKKHVLIQYILNNLHFEFSITRKYWKDLMMLLTNKTKNIRVDRFENLLIGNYNGMKINKMLLRQFPFEISLSINSTIARLEVLSKWNELTSSPQFVRQMSFSQMFGFIVNDFQSFYRKLYLVSLIHYRRYMLYIWDRWKLLSRKHTTFSKFCQRENWIQNRAIKAYAYIKISWRRKSKAKTR